MSDNVSVIAIDSDSASEEGDVMHIPPARWSYSSPISSSPTSWSPRSSPTYSPPPNSNRNYYRKGTHTYYNLLSGDARVSAARGKRLRCHPSSEI